MKTTTRLRLALAVLVAAAAPQVGRADYAVSMRPCTATVTGDCTTYTKPYNWAVDQAPWYYYTSYSLDKEHLDDTRDPDQPFGAHFTGTATATVAGMDPGLYVVQFKFRRTPNRTRCALWRVTPDGRSARALGGSIDQRSSAEHPDTGAGTVGTYDLPETRATPLPVSTSLTLVVGTDVFADCFNGDGSVAYGGAVFVRVGDLPPPSVAQPTITPPGGTFTAPQDVTLACATAGAEIRYTTDGTAPTASAALYASPFTLTASCRVRARAYLGGDASEGAAANFTFIPPPDPDGGPEVPDGTGETRDDSAAGDSADGGDGDDVPWIPESTAGCGCAVGSRPSAWLGLPLLLLVLLRRRRPDPTDPPRDPRSAWMAHGPRPPGAGRAPAVNRPCSRSRRG